MKSKYKTILFHGCIFLFFLIYFLKVTPLVPFDGDDWTYLGQMRFLPLPLWGNWNPTRVLPEVLSPLSGYFAAFLIYPLTHHYVFALSLSRAIIVSLCLTLFFGMFYKFLKNRLHINNKRALASELVFLLSFFLICKHLNHSSYTGFWTRDYACTFFYLVPGLLNGGLMFYLLQFRDAVQDLRHKGTVEKAIFVTALYFAIFSSSQFNIILAIVAFWQLLLSVINSDDNRSLMEIIRKNYLFIGIIIGWFITIIFDLNGGRSADLSKNTGLVQLVRQSVPKLKGFAAILNHSYLAFCFILAIVVWFLLFKKRQQIDSSYVELFSLFWVGVFVSFAYLYVAYLKAGVGYFLRVDAMWPVLFYLNLIFTFSVTFVLNNFTASRSVGPLFFVLLVIIAFNYNYQPLQVNDNNVDAKTMYRIDNYIIRQIVKADRSGKSSVRVYVPQNGDSKSKAGGANWPQSYNMAFGIANSLYVHHITPRRLNVTFVPSKKVSQKFYKQY